MGWGPCFISLREAWPATVGLALAAQGCGLFETQQAFTAYSGSGSDASTHDAAAQGQRNLDDNLSYPAEPAYAAAHVTPVAQTAVAQGNGSTSRSNP